MPKFLGYPLSVPTIDYIDNVPTLWPNLTPTVGMRIVSTGTAVSGANKVAPNQEWLYTSDGWRPTSGSIMFAAYQTATQNMGASSDGTYFSLTWQNDATSVYVNPFNAWTSANLDRFYAPWNGLYQFSGGIGFASAAAQHFAGWKIGTGVSYSNHSVSAGLTGLYVPARTVTYKLTFGQYVSLVGMASGLSSGTAWSTAGGSSGVQPNMNVTWLGTG